MAYTVTAPSLDVLPWSGFRGKYYVASFVASVRDIWGASPWRNELGDLCLSSAIQCFLSDTDADVVSRQRTLVAYCAGEFDLADTENVIYRLLHRLPADADVLEKFLRDGATLYSYPARRWFGADPNVSSPDWEELYSAANIPDVEAQAYELAKVHGSVVVRPFQVDGRVHMEVHTPDRSRWEASRAQTGGLSRLAYPVTRPGEGDRRTALRVWGPVDYRDYSTQDGKLLQVVPHNYGTVPAVLLKLGRAQFDLLDEQVRQNWALFLSQSNAGLNGSPIRMAVNMDLQNRGLSMGLGKVLELNDVADGSAGLGLAEPSLEFVSPESEAYRSITEWAEARSQSKLSRKGIPWSLLEPTTVPASGISRVVEREGLNIQRRKDADRMAHWASTLARVLHIVLQKDAEASVAKKEAPMWTNLPEPDLVVRFGAEPVFQEPSQEYELDRKRTFEDGTMDLAEFARRHMTGYTGNVDPEEVLLFIRKNLDRVSTLKRSATPTPSPTLDTPSTP